MSFPTINQIRDINTSINIENSSMKSDKLDESGSAFEEDNFKTSIFLKIRLSPRD